MRGAAAFWRGALAIVVFDCAVEALCGDGEFVEGGTVGVAPK